MTRPRDSAKLHFDVVGAIDDLHQLISKADAMVCATERQLEGFTWNGKDESRDEDDCGDRRLEHLSHLLGATKEAVQAAVHACGRIVAELAKLGERS